MPKSIEQKRHAGRAVGFTLIKIMVAVTIVAILGAAVPPLILSMMLPEPYESRVARAGIDMANYSQALKLYELNNHHYPSTDQGLQALVKKPTGDPEPENYAEGGYMKSIAKDPWGRDYVYVSPGENGDFDIISLGADGVEGGDTVGADITHLDPIKLHR